MREALTLPSRMEALTERRTSASETGCTWMGAMERPGAAHAAHPVATGNPPRPVVRTLPGPRNDWDRRPLAAVRFSRNHSVAGAAQGWQRNRQLAVPCSRPAHQPEMPHSITSIRSTPLVWPANPAVLHPSRHRSTQHNESSSGQDRRPILYRAKPTQPNGTSP